MQDSVEVQLFQTVCPVHPSSQPAHNSCLTCNTVEFVCYAVGCHRYIWVTHQCQVPSAALNEPDCWTQHRRISADKWIQSVTVTLASGGLDLCVSGSADVHLDGVTRSAQQKEIQGIYSESLSLSFSLTHIHACTAPHVHARTHRLFRFFHCYAGQTSRDQVTTRKWLCVSWAKFNWYNLCAASLSLCPSSIWALRGLPGCH